MGKRIPTPSEAVTYLATRHVAEQPDQKVEFGWPEIEAANEEYERTGVSGMMLSADADRGTVRVSFGKLADQLEEAAALARDGEARGLRMERAGNGFVGVRAHEPKPEWKPENDHVARAVANAQLAGESVAATGHGGDAAFLLGMQVGLTLLRDHAGTAIDLLAVMERWYRDAEARGETAHDVIPAMVKEIGEGVDIPPSDPIWGGVK